MRARKVSGDWWVDGVHHHVEGVIFDEGTLDLGVIPRGIKIVPSKIENRQAKDLGCDPQPEGGPHARLIGTLILIATALAFGVPLWLGLR